MLPITDPAPETPNAADDTLQYAFLAYDRVSPPAGYLIDHLRAAFPEGRDAMINLALAFIEGDPPYANAFISHSSALATPLRDFPEIARRLHQSGLSPATWLGALRVAVSAIPGGNPATWFTSRAYAAEIDRVWQSYFALTIVSGYNQALMDDLSEILLLDHAIRLGLRFEASGEIGLEPLTTVQSAALASATIILPATVFPMPRSG